MKAIIRVTRNEGGEFWYETELPFAPIGKFVISLYCDGFNPLWLECGESEPIWKDNTWHVWATIDWCNPASDEELEQEIADLRSFGLRPWAECGYDRMDNKCSAKT